MDVIVGMDIEVDIKNYVKEGYKSLKLM